MRTFTLIRFSLAKESLTQLKLAVQEGESIHTAAKRILVQTLVTDPLGKEIEEIKARILALEIAIAKLNPPTQ